MGAAARKLSADHNMVASVTLLSNAQRALLGAAIAPISGQLSVLAKGVQSLVALECTEVSSPLGARAAVRRAVGNPADAIRVIVDSEGRLLDLSELHAIAAQSIELAIEGGFDSIEDAYRPSEAQPRVMARNGITLVATDVLFEDYLDSNADPASFTRAQVFWVTWL
jgi:hypothetical protein